MRPLRLVIVTRSFWPLVGGPEKLLANLAVELAARGCQPAILTARWGVAWPSEIRFREVPVVRLGPPPDDAWRTFRFLRAVGRWLRQHADQFDLAYVSGLDEEAGATLRALRGCVPVILRAERASHYGDGRRRCALRARARSARRGRAAAGVVAPSDIIRHELEGLGYPAEAIRPLPNGVPLPPPRTPASRSAARAVLAATHPALQLPDSVPLAVYTGRLTRDRGLRTIIQAWRLVADRWPNARLWLAGEGPETKSLDEQIDALGLAGTVVQVGVFGSVEDLLTAADLFVLPGLDAGTCTSLLEAMAAGLPIVASDIAAHRAWITPGHSGLLAAVGDGPAFASAATRLLDEPNLAAQLGAAARQRAVSEASLDDMVTKHIELFSSLVSALQR